MRTFSPHTCSPQSLFAILLPFPSIGLRSAAAHISHPPVTTITHRLPFPRLPPSSFPKKNNKNHTNTAAHNNQQRFDPFMNTVLDEATDESSPAKPDIGMVVIRGNSIMMIENLVSDRRRGEERTGNSVQKASHEFSSFKACSLCWIICADPLCGAFVSLLLSRGGEKSCSYLQFVISLDVCFPVALSSRLPW